MNQRLAVVNLQSWGHDVAVANDGEQPVAAAAREQFDLVLMDCQMPKTGRHVPIVAMTANVMKGFREQCLAAGMGGYVAKPIRREELVAAMAVVIPDLLIGADAAAPAEADELPNAKRCSIPRPCWKARVTIATSRSSW